MKNRNKLIFGIFYFGLFIILGFFAIKFFLFEADYSRNTVPTVSVKFYGSSEGRTYDRSPLIQGITFFVAFISATFMAITNKKRINKTTQFGVFLILTILLLATILSFLRYYTQASLFDFIDPNTY